MGTPDLRIQRGLRGFSLSFCQSARPETDSNGRERSNRGMQISGWSSCQTLTRRPGGAEPRQCPSKQQRRASFHFKRGSKELPGLFVCLALSESRLKIESTPPPSKPPWNTEPFKFLFGTFPFRLMMGFVCDPLHPLASVQPLSASCFRPTAVVTPGVCLTAAEPRCQELAGLPLAAAAAAALCAWKEGGDKGLELASFWLPSLAPRAGEESSS